MAQAHSLDIYQNLSKNREMVRIHDACKAGSAVADDPAVGGMWTGKDTQPVTLPPSSNVYLKTLFAFPEVRCLFFARSNVILTKYFPGGMGHVLLHAFVSSFSMVELPSQRWYRQEPTSSRQGIKDSIPSSVMATSRVGYVFNDTVTSM